MSGEIIKVPSGYGTFSGSDMVVSLVFPNSSPYAVGECSTVTYSTLRDVQEVRTLGRISVRGFTRGQRRVAGTIIFTVFEQHIVNNIKNHVAYLQSLSSIKSDELPPFDIIITFGSEYGRSARLVIYGAVVLEEGKVMSIEDLFTENTWTYLARDIRPMENLDGNQEQTIPSTQFYGQQSVSSGGPFVVTSLSIKRS